jgi:hypothetical protein
MVLLRLRECQVFQATLTFLVSCSTLCHEIQKFHPISFLQLTGTHGEARLLVVDNVNNVVGLMASELISVNVFGSEGMSFVSPFISI